MATLLPLVPKCVLSPSCLLLLLLSFVLTFLFLLLIHTCHAWFLLVYPCFLHTFVRNRTSIFQCCHCYVSPYLDCYIISFVLILFFSTTVIPEECCTKTCSNHLFSSIALFLLTCIFPYPLGCFLHRLHRLHC